MNAISQTARPDTATTPQPLFHLAFPVDDLAKARAFYGGLLGCPEGRSSDAWIDFDFHGHQIVAHLAPEEVGHRKTSPVDGHDVPVRHFGAILTLPEWHELANRLKAAGTVSEQEGCDRFIARVLEASHPEPTAQTADTPLVVSPACANRILAAQASPSNRPPSPVCLA